MRVKTWLNAEEFPTVGEINTLPSMTIPDQTMSIREIMTRFAKGLPVTGAREPLFDEDGEENDLPDPRTLDFAEQQEMAQKMREELFELRSADAKRKAELQARERQEQDDFQKVVAFVKAGGTLPPAPSTNIP